MPLFKAAPRCSHPILLNLAQWLQHTLCDSVNVLTFLIILIVIMTSPVFSFIAAESRQTSRHRSWVFPQIFAGHWCPSARKVCNPIIWLFLPANACKLWQACIFSISNIWWNKYLRSHSDFVKALNVCFIYFRSVVCNNLLGFYCILFMIFFNRTCLRLGAVLWSASVPFLVCKSYGLIGYMRLVVQEHTGGSQHLK